MEPDVHQTVGTAETASNDRTLLEDDGVEQLGAERLSFVTENAKSSADNTESMSHAGPQPSDGLHRHCGLVDVSPTKNKNQLLSMWDGAVHCAEETRHQLMSMSGQALHRAEETRDHLLSMSGEAIRRATETKDQLVTMSEQAFYRAEEKTEKLMAMSGQAFHRAEEIAQNVWDAGWKTLKHHHLPNWLRDNEYLLHGHRPPLNCFYRCFWSIFRIHTETGNIWTHLIGWLAFIAIAIHLLTRPSSDIIWHDHMVLFVYIMSAVACFGLSWTYHTLSCHSEKIGLFFCRLDYSGVVMLITGSVVAWLHYCFECEPTTHVTVIATTTSLGVVCVTIAMSEEFSKVSYRTFRAGVFLCLGLSGLIPIKLHLIRTGVEQSVIAPAFGYFLLMMLLYGLGTLVYSTRFPECFWPGKFDIWFASHQLFHVLVLAATLVNCHAIFTVASVRYGVGCAGSGNTDAGLVGPVITG